MSILCATDVNYHVDCCLATFGLVEENLCHLGTLKVISFITSFLFIVDVKLLGTFDNQLILISFTAILVLSNITFLRSSFRTWMDVGKVCVTY